MEAMMLSNSICSSGHRSLAALNIDGHPHILLSIRQEYLPVATATLDDFILE